MSQNTPSIFRNEAWPFTSSSSPQSTSCIPGLCLQPVRRCRDGAGKTPTLLSLVCSCLRSCCSVVETVVNQITAFSCVLGAALAFVSLCLAQCPHTGISVEVLSPLLSVAMLQHIGCQFLVPEVECITPRCWPSAPHFPVLSTGSSSGWVCAGRWEHLVCGESIRWSGNREGTPPRRAGAEMSRPQGWCAAGAALPPVFPPLPGTSLGRAVGLSMWVSHCCHPSTGHPSSLAELEMGTDHCVSPQGGAE